MEVFLFDVESESLAEQVPELNGLPGGMVVGLRAGAGDDLVGDEVAGLLQLLDREQETVLVEFGN